eukprot:2805564-Prymnesium_polylepis.1
MAWRASIKRPFVASLATRSARVAHGRSPSPSSRRMARSRSCAALTALTGGGGAAPSAGAGGTGAAAEEPRGSGEASGCPSERCTCGRCGSTPRRSPTIIVSGTSTVVACAANLLEYCTVATDGEPAAAQRASGRCGVAALSSA